MGAVTMGAAYNAILRGEYMKLVSEVGHAHAASIVALQLGYGDNARLLVANTVVPDGYAVVTVRYNGDGTPVYNS
jgi:hypothetical protein